MLPLVPCRCQSFVEGPEGRTLAASPMYPALRRALVVHLMMLREFLLLEPQDVFRWGGRPAGAGCCARTGRQAGIQAPVALVWRAQQSPVVGRTSKRGQQHTCCPTRGTSKGHRCPILLRWHTMSHIPPLPRADVLGSSL